MRVLPPRHHNFCGNEFHSSRVPTIDTANFLRRRRVFDSMLLEPLNHDEFM